MAISNTTTESEEALPVEPGSSPAQALLLVSLASQDQGTTRALLTNLADAFAGERVLVMTPDDVRSLEQPSGLEVQTYVATVGAAGNWTPIAADFVNDMELLRQHRAGAILHLGQGAESLDPQALRALTEDVLAGSRDLAVAHYTLPAGSGLVNSSMLYPVVRALFGVNVRFPLALDYCISAQGLERAASNASRFVALNQAGAIVWPVIDCAVAGLPVSQVAVGARTLPQPDSLDLNAVLAQVAGSLFTEVDQRAAFWQRSRVAAATVESAATGSHVAEDQIASLQASFRLAYANLHEVWALVLPPQTLLGLKRLSAMPAESFSLPDPLWARIVYDFLLAYRLRTINRGHLLGALTPLYLAWVASHLLLTRQGGQSGRHIEAVAAAFEAEKPYLVSRWRWPDRFNP